ncbi:MAG: hypothetical protein AB8G05_14085 [Oligoflexales bacterium]
MVAKRIFRGLAAVSIVSNLLTYPLYAQELRSSQKEGETASTNSLLTHISGGEGKVLPRNVARARVVNRIYSSGSGFDNRGHKLELGLDQKLGVRALVAEYGITEKLSFRMLAPFVYQNQLTMDEEAFKRSATYQNIYAQKANEVAQVLLGRMCNDMESCRKIIDSRDQTAPQDYPITLDTGEKIIIPAGSIIADAIEDSILNGVRRPKDGATGLGDMEFGLLYNAYQSNSLSLSAGLGLRTATGKFNLPEGQRPIGEGLNDLGARLNLDYCPTEGLWISFQEQLEMAISKARWKRPSMLDSSKYNEADPYEGGDGLPNSRTIEKVGFMTATMLKANYGLGALDSSLKALAVNASYEYRRDRAKRIDRVETTPQSNIETASIGAIVSGLPYRIPLEFEANYVTPIKGKNVTLARSTIESVVRLYTRF